MDLYVSLQISEKFKAFCFGISAALYCVILSCNGLNSYNMCLGVGLFCSMSVFLTFFCVYANFFWHRILLFVSYGIYFCIVVISIISILFLHMFTILNLHCRLEVTMVVRRYDLVLRNFPLW
jgi:hypothetical protein